MTTQRPHLPAFGFALAFLACEPSTPTPTSSTTATATSTARPSTARPSAARPSASATKKRKPASLTSTLFAIEDYKRNEESCDEAGKDAKSQLRGHTHMFFYRMKTSLSPTGSLLGIGTCDAPKKCRDASSAFAKDAKKYPGTSLAFNFHAEKKPGKWEGVYMMSGYGGEENTCRKAVYASTSAKLEGDRLTITVQGAMQDIAAGKGGICGTSAVKEALETAPCNLTHVITARAVGPLEMP